MPTLSGFYIVTAAVVFAINIHFRGSCRFIIAGGLSLAHFDRCTQRQVTEYGLALEPEADLSNRWTH